MVQYKLCTIYRDSQDNLMDKLNEIFGNKSVNVINDSCVAIEYNYTDMDYKLVLSHIAELQIGQMIVTSDIMFFLLRESLESKITIREINFIDTINTEDNKIIENYIKNLYINKNTIEYVNILSSFLHELEWIVSDESIDIVSITLNIEQGSKDYDIKIFNNGVILSDNPEIVKNIFTIISNVLKGK